MKIISITKARDIVGGTYALANLLGIKPPNVSQWIYGKNPVPIKWCPAIERATYGQVTCEELRPDMDWAFLRKSKKRKST